MCDNFDQRTSALLEINIKFHHKNGIPQESLPDLLTKGFPTPAAFLS